MVPRQMEAEVGEETRASSWCLRQMGSEKGQTRQA